MANVKTLPGGKFGKHRLVPHGPRIVALIADYIISVQTK